MNIATVNRVWIEMLNSDLPTLLCFKVIDMVIIVILIVLSLDELPGCDIWRVVNMSLKIQQSGNDHDVPVRALLP